MQPTTKVRSSQIIEALIQQAELTQHITVGQLIHALGERAFGLAILIFSLPNLLPFTAIPGFAAISSIPIIIFGLQMLIGQGDLWLPQRVHAYAFSSEKFVRVMRKIVPILKRIEKMLRPRWLFLSGKLGEQLLGLLFIFLALLLMLPIPFSNFIFGLVMSLLAIGLIERDGVVIALGLLGSLIYMTVIFAAFWVLIKKLFGL